ncbi:hypothetical protein [Litorimonas sp. WD9-15]|uniref:hypothetical protein n=1 Tax=Litorimonas sp. WD9-15 TaxID=3418716 RepID=UPI003CFC77E2
MTDKTVQTLVTGNAVDFIVTQFFGGVQANLARAMNIPTTTLTSRAKVGQFTSGQQKTLLQLSDENSWGIRPVHFFPDRLTAADIPPAIDVTKLAA